MPEAIELSPQPPTSFASRVFWDLCWLAVLFGLVAATARVVAHDGHMVLIWLNTISLYLYVSPLLILPLAIWRRRRRLAMASGILMVCLTAWVGPDFFHRRSPPTEVTDAARLRIFSANLYTQNSTPDRILDEIRTADPDVIAFQEFSQRWKTAFRDSDIAVRYPFQRFHTREDAFGIAAFSKYELEDVETWITGEVPMLLFTLRVKGIPIRIYNWHPLPPRTLEYVNAWNHQYTALIARLVHETKPVIIAGDFNATQHAYWMKQLSKAGFKSAHREVGHGWAVTFPNGTSRLPPIRLDHILYTSPIMCLDINEGQGAGSDHKPLIANFLIPAAGKSRTDFETSR